MWRKMPLTHRSRDTAHAQWLQRHYQWYRILWEMSELITRSENMAKIALNAVRLPKFEVVNGKSWSPRTMVVKDIRQR